MSGDANGGQVTVIPLENKLNFTPTQKPQHMFHCCLMGLLMLFAETGEGN